MEGICWFLLKLSGDCCFKAAENESAVIKAVYLREPLRASKTLSGIQSLRSDLLPKQTCCELNEKLAFEMKSVQICRHR